MVPVKFPFRSVVTLVNGRVFTPTGDVFPGMVPVGGLKSMVGKFWLNTGVAVGGVSKEPEPSEAKKRPKMVVVETGCVGVTQLMEAVLELTCVPPRIAAAWTVSVPFTVPE